MTYYWIIAQHSGKVLDVANGSVNNGGQIIQYTKKLADDPTVSPYSNEIVCLHISFIFFLSFNFFCSKIYLG